MFKSIARKTNDPITQMRADIETARIAVDAAEEELGNAVLDAAGKPEDLMAAKRVREGEAALIARRTRLGELLGTLAAVERTGNARAVSDAAKAAAKALAQRWAEAEAQGKARERAAKAVEAAGAAVGKAWREVEAASAAMTETQLAHDPDGAMLRINDLERALLHGLAKASGLHWLAKGVPPYVLDELPPLSSRIEAANLHLLNQRVGI